MRAAKPIVFGGFLRNMHVILALCLLLPNPCIQRDHSVVICISLASTPEEGRIPSLICRCDKYIYKCRYTRWDAEISNPDQTHSPTGAAGQATPPPHTASMVHYALARCR